MAKKPYYYGEKAWDVQQQEQRQQRHGHNNNNNAMAWNSKACSNQGTLVPHGERAESHASNTQLVTARGPQELRKRSAEGIVPPTIRHQPTQTKQIKKN